MPQKTQRAMAKPENTFKALKRIFSYMYGFRVQFIFVVICIIFSSFAGIIGNSLLKPLIDNLDHAIDDGKWHYGRFIGILVLMASIYVMGALCSLFYQRMMMKIASASCRSWSPRVG